MAIEYPPKPSAPPTDEMKFALLRIINGEGDWSGLSAKFPLAGEAFESDGIGVDFLHDTVSIHGQVRPWKWLFDRLWWCLDIAPQPFWPDKGDDLVYKKGTRVVTYAELARLQAWEGVILDYLDEGKYESADGLIAELLRDLRHRKFAVLGSKHT